MLVIRVRLCLCQSIVFVLGVGMCAHWESLQDKTAPCVIVLRTMREKKIELLALSEVRGPGHGMSCLYGAVIIHSSMAESDPQNRRRGVAVVIEERAATA